MDGQMDRSVLILKTNLDSHTVYMVLNTDQFLKYNKITKLTYEEFICSNLKPNQDNSLTDR